MYSQRHQVVALKDLNTQNKVVHIRQFLNLLKMKQNEFKQSVHQKNIIAWEFCGKTPFFV